MNKDKALKKFEKEVKEIEEEIRKIETELVERPMGFFNKLFDAVPAPYIGLIGYLSFSSFILVAFILYIIEDPTFSIFNNWISQLSVGEEGSNFFFFLALSVSSPFIFLFHYSLVNNFYFKTNKVGILLYLYSAASTETTGRFFAGIFPLTLHKVHGFFAIMYFFGAFAFYSGLFYLFFTIKNESNRNKKLLLCGATAIMTAFFQIAEIYSSLTGDLFPFISNFLLEWFVYLTYLFTNFGIILINLMEKNIIKI